MKTSAMTRTTKTRARAMRTRTRKRRARTLTTTTRRSMRACLYVTSDASGAANTHVLSQEEERAAQSEEFGKRMKYVVQ